MKTDRVTCEYCAVLNPPDGKRCIACGAPLPVKSTPPLRVTVVDSPPLPLADAARLEPPSISQPLKEGASVVAAGLGALGVGTILLRGSRADHRGGRGRLYHRDKYRPGYNHHPHAALDDAPGPQRWSINRAVRGPGEQARFLEPDLCAGGRPSWNGSGYLSFIK